MSETVSAIIVDDEALARQVLRELLNQLCKLFIFLHLFLILRIVLNYLLHKLHLNSCRRITLHEVRLVAQ